MEVLRLGDGPLEVELLPEVGARLHRLRAFGHDLLRTPDDPEAHRREPFFWGGYVMAPWCNRIDVRPLEVAGRRVAVPANFPDGSAIHGQVYDRPWEIIDPGELRVRAGGDGWPWTYEVTERLAVDGASLRVTLSLTNTSDGPMPAGAGLHPWLRRPVRVAVAAESVYTSNAEPSPGPEPVAGAHDLRRLSEMAPGLDATWTDLAQPAVELLWPEAGVGATMRTTASHVTAANPPDLDAVAVEPQSHAPQGLRRLLNAEPGALARLEPGGTLDLNLEIDFERR